MFSVLRGSAVQKCVDSTSKVMSPGQQNSGVDPKPLPALA